MVLYILLRWSKEHCRRFSRLLVYPRMRDSLYTFATSGIFTLKTFHHPVVFVKTIQKNEQVEDEVISPLAQEQVFNTVVLMNLKHRKQNVCFLLKSDELKALSQACRISQWQQVMSSRWASGIKQLWRCPLYKDLMMLLCLIRCVTVVYNTDKIINQVHVN